MSTNLIPETYFSEDGLVEGPLVECIKGIGGSHWTNHPIEVYALEGTTTPYHAHFYMSKAKARANWHRLTASAKRIIYQCKSVSFELPDSWHQWENTYLRAKHNYQDTNPDFKAQAYFYDKELIKWWDSGMTPAQAFSIWHLKNAYIPRQKPQL
tara:strand:- start:3638 stop:4099 length:462 start_codon:yes stop_codon:yes gene_type:complete